VASGGVSAAGVALAGLVHRKGNAPAPGPDAPGVARLQSRLREKPSGESLPESVRAAFESAAGLDLGDVRVHTDSEAAAIAEALGARALAVGRHIFFARGAYNPGQSDGLALLAHELAHTVQSGAGEPSPEAVREISPESSGLEAEADAIASRVVSARAGGAQDPRAQGSMKGVARTAEVSLARASTSAAGRHQIQRQNAPGARSPEQAREHARQAAQRLLQAFQGIGTTVQEVYRSLNDTPEMVRLIRDIYDAEFNRHTGQGLVADLFDEMGGEELDFAIAQLRRAGISVPSRPVQYEQPDVSGRNEVRITAEPDVPVAMPGTRMTFRLERGPEMYAQGSYYTYQWYCLNDPESSRQHGTVARYEGPSTGVWEGARWDFAGNHRIICRTQFHPRGERPRPPQYVERRQLVMPRQTVTDEAFRQTQAMGDPQQRLSGVQTYLQVLERASQRPGSAPLDSRTREQLNLYIERSRQRLASTQNTTRHPIRAVHVATESAQITPLQVFVARTGNSGGQETWKIVDMTNPVDRRLTGEYEGSGPNAAAAIRAAVRQWNSNNRYPTGLLRLEVPPAVAGENVREQFSTDGASFWDSIAEFFNNVGLVAGIGALALGVITAIAPVPGSQAVSVLIWTSIIASTTGAVISIAQRQAEGISSPTEDALDILTIAGNILAGGSLWARGARVVVGNQGGSRILRGFIIGQFATDAGQGIVLSTEYARQYDEIMQIQDPQQRTDRLLAMLRSASVAGGIMLLSMGSNASELRSLRQQGVSLSVLNDTNAEIDLTRRAVSGVQPAAAAHAAVDPMAAARTRVGELEAGGTFATSQFHGSNSQMLSGLENTQGQILSAAELERRGITRQTGEGDTFSGRSGPKQFISVGQGDAGLGTGLAYARASRELTHYNVQLYRYQELTDEIAHLERTAQAMRSQGMTRIGPPGMGPELTQIDNRLSQLRQELARRNQMPANHPLREGGPAHTTDYPVLFEFDGQGLNTRARGDVQPGGPLGGEAMVYDPIDLRTRLRRVYVPAERVSDARSRLQRILGHNNFEVIPIEALDALQSTGVARRTQAATQQLLRQLQENFDGMTEVVAPRSRRGVD
jgi:hypothetical protein